MGTTLHNRSTETGVTDINSWASEATSNQIPQAAQEMEDAMIAPLLLTSVSSIKAAWTKPFDPFHTWPGEFQNSVGEVVLCHYMHQKGKFECSYTQDFRAVRLPCGAQHGAAKGANVAVTFLLPNFDSIDDAVDCFTAERWQEMCRTVIKEDVKLYLPRFKMQNASCLLKGELTRSGICDIFDELRADLSRFGETGRFWLGDVLHKSAFSMDETGAVPVDGVEDGCFEISCAASAQEFRLDRPFLFVVHYGECILQLGKVVAPLD